MASDNSKGAKGGSIGLIAAGNDSEALSPLPTQGMQRKQGPIRTRPCSDQAVGRHGAGPRILGRGITATSLAGRASGDPAMNHLLTSGRGSKTKADDALFYASPGFVHHLDAASPRLTALYQQTSARRSACCGSD